MDVRLGSLEGGVVDESFTPIPGIVVTVLGTGSSAVTDTEGHFQILNLPADDYSVEVAGEGWETSIVPLKILSGQLLKITIFMDPADFREEYNLLETFQGKVTCTVVQAAGQTVPELSCPPVKRSFGFKERWAATVTEVVWGPSGASSSADATVTLQYTESSTVHRYQQYKGASPAKLILEPAQLYDTMGGDTKTPKAGVVGPLDVVFQKAPTQAPGGAGSVGTTFDQPFVMYHTTFYNGAPSNLKEFSQLPPPE